MTAVPARSTPFDVGIVGTFDVANFGDLLFPEIAAYELEQRLGPVKIHRYSHRPMAAPPWPYEVLPVDEMIDAVEGIDLLVVGGGHLIRFDATVAPGYEAVGAGVAHPVGYWLSPTLVAAEAGVPVAWNALGASADTPLWARPLLSGALEATDYVSVRDGASLAELAAVAPIPARLVPDTAFGIRAILERRPPAPELPIEAELVGRKYVLVQASAGLRSAADAIRRAIEHLDPSELVVLEVPVSPVIGDRIGALGDLPARVMPVDPWPHPLALARLIAGAQAVIGQSLHLSIVAVAHGIPVFRPADPPDTKYELLEAFPGVAMITSGDDLGRALAAASRRAPSPQVQERVSQLRVHWDRVAGLVTSDSSKARTRRRRMARRALTLVPGAMAGADGLREELLAAARQELEASEAKHDALRSELAVGAAARDALGIELAAATTARESLEQELRAISQRNAKTASVQAETAHRATELAERVGTLEAAIARERAQGSNDRLRADQELAKLRAQIDAMRSELLKLRNKAATLDRLQSRRSFRTALAAARLARRSATVLGIRRGVGPTAPPSVGAGRRMTATPEQEQEAKRALLASARGSPRTEGPLVSIIVLNRDGAGHLRRLMSALEGTTYRGFEIIVVDNGSTDESVAFLQESANRLPVTVLQNDVNRGFGEANNQGVSAASGDLVLFLNNDIEPIEAGWLGRLVDTLEQHDAAAVGARLVYPRRPAGGSPSERHYPDLTLQHRGIEFVAADGVPTGRNLGPGTDPLSDRATRVGDAPAVTAACLLVRRDAFSAVGGFSSGYMYGTEDVDLSLKLRASGGRIIYDGGAVLWHHEYATQNVLGREWKRRNRTRNRQQFVDRWAPQAFREVLRDRVMGTGRWSETPLHVAVTLTRDDPAAGWGDYYSAHEIGDALVELGWRVSYAERYRDHWYGLDPNVDVVISLLDSFDVRRIPRGIVSVAWVRNWTDRWIGQPWFDEYDIVLASSSRSQEIIAARTTRTPALMPLATNPERFAPRPANRELQADLLFVGNNWGVRRSIEDLLPAVAPGRVVQVYGRDWESTELADFYHGNLDYDRLSDAYASARIVLDDTAGPTMPYGAVNARVFDAIATGALVISDNEAGVRELFGDDFPVARDADELEARIAWAEADPSAAAELQERMRQIVLERHTYKHRAIELRDHLLNWVDAERYAILIGIPDWEQAPAWGDYHFARGLQRQLERRGHPTRIHLLEEWNRAPSARADVAVHLHGLSDHRPRPSQLNALWIISHPDRISPQVCDRYDIVFVASQTFAAGLAGRVRVPVVTLEQATDPERFVPDPTGPIHDLLFVANTRGVRRAIVDDLLPTVHELAIYGQGWTAEIVDPVHVRADHVPNDVLNRYYSSARVVLNDHWPDMRANGFLSNRLYDALACGACVISDEVVGMDETFEGTILSYKDRDELRRLVDMYLSDAEARRALGERGRAIVLERHTFGHRIDQLLAAIAGLEQSRPMRIESWSEIDAWIGRRRRRSSESMSAPSRDLPGLSIASGR